MLRKLIPEVWCKSTHKNPSNRVIYKLIAATLEPPTAALHDGPVAPLLIIYIPHLYKTPPLAAVPHGGPRWLLLFNSRKSPHPRLLIPDRRGAPRRPRGVSFPIRLKSSENLQVRPKFPPIPIQIATEPVISIKRCLVTHKQ